VHDKSNGTSTDTQFCIVLHASKPSYLLGLFRSRPIGLLFCSRQIDSPDHLRGDGEQICQICIIKHRQLSPDIIARIKNHSRCTVPLAACIHFALFAISIPSTLNARRRHTSCDQCMEAKSKNCNIFLT
jgi:hypothetical protein